MKLVTVAEMQAIESEANAAGLTYELMMENAGRSLAQVVSERYGFMDEQGICGIIGSGNNGGDALVALSALAMDGWKASAYLARPRPADDALVSRLLQSGGILIDAAADPDNHYLAQMLHTHSILLDGVLGTGLRLPLKPDLATLLDYVRKTILEMSEPPLVVAVDCPSGMDCDSGEIASQAIPADLTITMAAVKQGLLKFPAYNLVGDLEIVGIGLPDDGESLNSWRSVHRVIPDADWVYNCLPARPLDAHKGTFGTALIVAGSQSYTGAAWLAGQAAYRIGAGLVTLAVPESLHAVLAGQFPEATWLLLPEEDGYINSGAAEIVGNHLNRVTALLIGPGFGVEKPTSQFLAKLLGRQTRSSIGFIPGSDLSSLTQKTELPPLVIDADGLKLLAQLPDWPSRLPPNSVLTPHPGEMSILTNLPKETIQSDRLSTAEQFSRQWGHVVVLKGAVTVIAAPDGRTAVIPVATPALARAGTGDVLSGLIAGLRAQGVEPFCAAASGAWIHAFAGLRAGLNLGNSASVLAGDVLKAIPEVLNDTLA
jgi:NAD(P)H-hydrate epimerase